MKKWYLLSLVLLVFFSCNKSTNCQQWLYYDECQAKTSAVCPVPIAYHKDIICGDELRDAQSGRVRTLSDDDMFLKTRHYIEKVQ